MKLRHTTIDPRILDPELLIVYSGFFLEPEIVLTDLVPMGVFGPAKLLVVSLQRGLCSPILDGMFSCVTPIQN